MSDAVKPMLSDEQWNRVLQSGFEEREYTDAEVCELAYDPSHLCLDQYLDFLEGKLSGNELEVVEQHLLTCQFCFSMTSSLRKLTLKANKWQRLHGSSLPTF